MIPHWQSRISPVFDAAQRVLLVEARSGRELRRSDHALGHTDVLAQSREVAQLRPDVLICGAISRPLETALNSAGIRVIAQTCGPVEEVLQAFLQGRLTAKAFLMPGCCGRRRQGMPGRHDIHQGTDK